MLTDDPNLAGGKPPTPLTDAEALERIAARIQAGFGLTFHDTRRPLLEVRAREMCTELEIGSLEGLEARLPVPPAGEALWKNLLARIVTRESFWFRQPDHFQTLKDFVLPAVISTKSFDGMAEVRILSAGCACGQEPYSLAILATELESQFPQVLFSIDACDVDEEALSQARTGEYSEPELRGLSAERRAKHFEQVGSRARASSGLRSTVRFFRHNLLEPVLAESYDVIFCRNVTIYFDHHTTERVLNHLAFALQPGGSLFAGHAETFREMSIPLRPVQMGPSIVYRHDRGSRLARKLQP